MGAHGKQALADVAPHASVDHGDAPVLLGIAEGLDVVAEAGDDAIGIDVRPVVEEELLDDVGLVAEAEHEILVPVLAVITHQMPEDRLAADRDHRLRDVLGIIADTRAETSAEQNCFHGPACLTTWASATLRSAGRGEMRSFNFFPKTGCQRCLSAAGAQRGHDVLEASAIGGTTVGAVPDPSLEGRQAGGALGYSPNAPELSEDLAHEECFGKPRRRVALDAAQPQQRPERLLVEPLSLGLRWKHLKQAGLSRLLAGSASRICQPIAYFHRIRRFLVLFHDLGGACRALSRND